MVAAIVEIALCGFPIRFSGMMKLMGMLPNAGPQVDARSAGTPSPMAGQRLNVLAAWDNVKNQRVLVLDAVNDDVVTDGKAPQAGA